jgi:hypothetical protein
MGKGCHIQSRASGEHMASDQVSRGYVHLLRKVQISTDAARCPLSTCGRGLTQAAGILALCTTMCALDLDVVQRVHSPRPLLISTPSDDSDPRSRSPRAALHTPSLQMRQRVRSSPQVVSSPVPGFSSLPSPRSGCQRVEKLRVDRFPMECLREGVRISSLLLLPCRAARRVP